MYYELIEINHLGHKNKAEATFFGDKETPEVATLFTLSFSNNLPYKVREELYDDEGFNIGEVIINPKIVKICNKIAKLKG